MHSLAPLRTSTSWSRRPQRMPLPSTPRSFEFGAPLRTRAGPEDEPQARTRELTARDFEDAGSWYTMGLPPVAIDILTEIQGISFNAAWKNRVTMVIDHATGTKAHSISRGDLIANKLAAGRPRDLADVSELHK